MFGSAILDIIIGLIFIYALISLFCTALNEAIASVFSLRSKMLKEWIKNFLKDPEMIKKFYNHPVIKNLSKNAEKQFPSYLAADVFSKVVINIISEEKFYDFNEIINKANLPYDFKKNITTLLESANNSFNNIKEQLEKFFNDSMERVSGWYKRKVQLIIYIISFCVCITFNVDTINIVKNLNLNSNIRIALSGYASQYIDSENESNFDVRTIKEELEELPLPLGWQSLSDELKKYCVDKKIPFIFWIEKFLGIILSSLAVSLGAPFWFDILKNVIRLTGKVPKNK